MTRHLLYLLGCGARNRLLRQVKRLRTPRYAIAVVIGLGYFYFILAGQYAVSRDSPPDMAEPLIGAAGTIGPLALALFASWLWIRGGRRSPLRLSPAETHILLPAPVTRRQIIRLKILQAQIGAVVSAGIGTILLRGGELAWPVRLVSLWMLIGTLFLHQVAASLVRGSAEEQGRAGLRRQALPLLVFGVTFGTLAVALARALVDIRATPSIAFAVDRLTAMMQEPGPAAVLIPFRLLLEPILAPDLGAWAPAFAAAAALFVLHYLWVLHTDAAFEEAAAEAGQREDEIRQAVRKGGMGQVQLFGRRKRIRPADPWLPLHATGRPVNAVFWKNVLFVQRLFRPLTLALLAAAAVVLVVAAAIAADTVADGLRVAGLLSLALAAMLTMLGPLTVRNDLRTDLRYIDLLRTWPVRGHAIVAAEIAAATATISFGQLVLAAAGMTLITVAGVLPLHVALLLFAATALIAPILNALGVCLQNAIALLFPGWARIGEHGGGGVEDFGQNILMLTATTILLVVAMVPPLLVAASVAGSLTIRIGATAAAITFIAGTSAVAAIATVVGEVILFIYVLGRLYDSTDVVTAGLLSR